MKKIPTYLWLIGTVLLVAGLNYLLPSTPQNSTVLIVVLVVGGFAARFAGRDGRQERTLETLARESEKRSRR